MNKGRSKAANVIRNLDALQNYIFNPDSGVGAELTPWSEGSKVSNALLNEVFLDLKSEDFKNMGAALTGNELAMLQSLMAKDPTGWRNLFTDQNKVLIQNLRDRLVNQVNLAGRQRGYVEQELGAVSGPTESVR
jgi:hypothetical protein